MVNNSISKYSANHANRRNDAKLSILRINFTDETILKVWQKAEIDEYNVPNDYRKDECGAWIERMQYGNHDSAYGWEIDHIKPISDGGLDDLPNLRPLHWKNNGSKDNGHLACRITSSGTTNVDRKLES